MVEASLAESRESSPHGQAPQDSAPKFVSRSETHGQMLEAALILEPKALLQITHATGTSGAWILEFAGTIAAD
jgi:hypothetical protein